MPILSNFEERGADRTISIKTTLKIALVCLGVPALGFIFLQVSQSSFPYLEILLLTMCLFGVFFSVLVLLGPSGIEKSRACCGSIGANKSSEGKKNAGMDHTCFCATSLLM